MLTAVTLGPKKQGLRALSFAAVHGLLIVGALAAGGDVPPRQADSQATIARLHAPTEGAVLVRGGLVQIGSDVHEIAQAQRMCRDELRREACATTLFADEMLVHDVVLSDYWLDRTEVTSEAYRRCVEVGACSWPSDPGTLRWTANPTHPATLVTWFDAERYCRWRGARLPTEAEWERAARGVQRRTFPWGQIYGPLLSNHGRAAANDLDRLDDTDGFGELAPVASFPAARTVEGIDDLAGNVEEWVADWYAEGYAEPELRDPKGPTAGDYRVLRGGSFLDGRAWLRGAHRHKDLPGQSHPWVGFRCAATAR